MRNRFHKSCDSLHSTKIQQVSSNNTLCNHGAIPVAPWYNWNLEQLNILFFHKNVNVLVHPEFWGKAAAVVLRKHYSICVVWLCWILDPMQPVNFCLRPFWLQKIYMCPDNKSEYSTCTPIQGYCSVFSETCIFAYKIGIWNMCMLLLLKSCVCTCVSKTYLTIWGENKHLLRFGSIWNFHEEYWTFHIISI